ncbi:MAG: ThiF family adenylyltransferase [bacterium]|nr:ThiF family adenylyltransferase [bacterium]
MYQIKVIGIGGIGTNLLFFLPRYLNTKTLINHQERYCLSLIDGDSVEPKNLQRQAFRDFGQKAEVKSRELSGELRLLSIRPVCEYVGRDNISQLIESGDIVFLCVDNHETRKLISDHCEVLEDVILISGGNELTDGNVQTFIRTGSKNLTYPITKFHPEIQNATGKTPREMNCGELAARPGGEQILVTNVAVASRMLETFWKVEQEMLDKIGEVYFDLKEGTTNTIVRSLNHEQAEKRKDGQTRKGRKTQNSAGLEKKQSPAGRRKKVRNGDRKALDSQTSTKKGRRKKSKRFAKRP